MKRRLRSLTTWSIALASWAAVWVASPGAQTPGAAAAKSPGKANWLTDGGDIQRTAWQKNETRISTETVKNMKLLWKLQLDNQPRQMHNLFPPLIVTDVTTAQGSKEVAVVAGVSDNIYGVDVATGARLWSRKFDSTFVEQPGGRGGGVLCPGGLTATPVIAPTDTAGRYLVYAVSWDGRLRTLDVATGIDAAPPEPFLPPNGKPYGLNLYKGVIYTTTAQGCGGNPNAFYGYDLATQEGRSVPARQRRDLAPHRSVDWQGRNGLRRVRRRRLLSRAPDLRPVDHRREAEPADQGARVEGLVHADERVLAAQARPRHERDRAGLRLQGQGVPGPVEQGVPSLAARHERARRRRSPHAGLSHAAHLQRGRQLRRRRHVGRARDLGRGERHALDPTCRSGVRSTRSSPRRSSTATSSAAAWPPSRWKTRPAKSC